jgi:hypothetical protein
MELLMTSPTDRLPVDGDRLVHGNMEICNWKLTPNFSLWEMIKSETHPQLVQLPDPIIILYLQGFCKMILQPMRDALGPIKVSSAWRNKELNAKVDGVGNSVHRISIGGVILGVAADIVPQDMKRACGFLATCNLPFTTAIVYPQRGFIHIDTRCKNTKDFFVSSLPKTYHQLTSEEFGQMWAS